MIAPLQELVLRSVRQLGPDCRANEVQETLTKLLSKEQAFGAIFTTLDRLTAKGFVRWEKGGPDNRRGWRAPRLYTITGDGIAALNEATRYNHAMHQLGRGEALPDASGEVI